MIPTFLLFPLFVMIAWLLIRRTVPSKFKTSNPDPGSESDCQWIRGE
jgi:hypothetical protein